MKPLVLVSAGGLILLVGLAVGWQVRPVPPPTYRDVVVRDTVILRQAPDTVLRVVDRIRWRVAEPTVVARGDSAAPERLDAYCRPDTVPNRGTIVPNVGTSDSSSHVSAPVLPPSSGKYDGRTLALFSVTSDGKLFAQETPVAAPFQWVARGGTYEVREERSGFRLFRGLPKVMLPLAAGFAAGVIVAK